MGQYNHRIIFKPKDENTIRITFARLKVAEIKSGALRQAPKNPTNEPPI